MNKLLVIEDNLQNMKLVRYILEEGGYTVLEAYTADEGLKLAKDEKPDLILMDIQLPGMDGMTAIRILREWEETKAIKILAITALAMIGDKDKILGAGADGYMSKPYSYKELLSNVKAMLASGGMEGAK